MLVVKADGTQEAFERHKLERSLRKAGANQGDTQTIADAIERSIVPNTTTASIYRDAFSMLRRLEAGTAARYSLRRAILEFGPSGFPFEAYLAEVFRTEGFEAVTNTVGRGRCVEHEIDVLLSKDGVRTYVEAKFHNTPGFKTDLKVVLYVQARVLDIKAREGEQVRGMVVTNTKFTEMARRYAECAGLSILGWDYPEKQTLEQRIEASGLYPITALTSLNRREKTLLLSQKVVLCNNLLQHTETLQTLGISASRRARVAQEVGALCQP